MFSQYADRVISIDITSTTQLNKKNAKNVWDFLGVTERIESYMIASDIEKKELISGLNFDIAFIDGGHKYEEIECDFSCVKKCGIVLFHDYKPNTSDYFDCDNIRYEEIVEFIDKLYPPAFIWGPHCGKFALWVDIDHMLMQSRSFIAWQTKAMMQQ